MRIRSALSFSLSHVDKITVLYLIMSTKLVQHVFLYKKVNAPIVSLPEKITIWVSTGL